MKAMDHDVCYGCDHYDPEYGCTLPSVEGRGACLTVEEAAEAEEAPDEV